jgi:hypothetical protein
MQIKHFFLFVIFAGAALCAGTPGNLLPEWESAAPGKSLLPQWRFAEWGSRSSGKKPLLRKHHIFEKEGKVCVTLENPAEGHSQNMLYRSLPLQEKEKKVFRFRIKGVNASQGKALLHLKLTAPGTPVLSREKFFTVTEVPAFYTIEMELPENRKTLSLQLSLSSPGKVTLSEALLTAHAPEAAAPARSVLPGGTFLLPERTPVLLPVWLPPRTTSAPAPRLRLTLPWGVRLVNSSAGSLQTVNVKVKEHTEHLLKLPARRIPLLYLLLATDLMASEMLHTGVLQWENEKEKSEKFFLRFQAVKDFPVVPPRSFRIILDGTDKVVPRELRADWDTALLRSGANVLNAPHLSIPYRTLRNARIDHFASLPLTLYKTRALCAYDALRNESFWESHFIPSVRRQLLRQGSSRISALICDSYLGQRRSIECLCALCRAELADFAPRLPRRAVMNYSRGLLISRYPKEVQNFRHSRLTALFEGARLHLPTGKNGFYRPPALIPSYTFFQALSLKAPVLKMPSAEIQFGTGATLPDGEIYNGAVELLCYEYARRQMAKLFPRCRLTAQLIVSPSRMTPEAVKFAILNCFFSHFQGIRLILTPEAGLTYRKAIAESAALLREYEEFFRKRKVTDHRWKVTASPETIQLPPVPGPGNHPLPLPSRTSSFRFQVWRSGNTTLIGITNLTARPLVCRLSGGTGKAAAVDGIKYSGTELLSKGVEVTVPEYSWKFLTVKE